MYGWETLPVNDLKLVEDISEFDESFIKNYNQTSDDGDDDNDDDDDDELFLWYG